MERRFSIFVGACVVLLTAFFMFRAPARSAPATGTAARADAGALVEALDAQATVAATARDAAAEAAAPSVEGPPGSRLADGTPVPPLPEKAPKTVRFGVVLVSYAGAQGAASNARSKAAAREMAEKLAADARTDFKGAVVRGDSGSMEDVGRVPRGVLEPAPEYVLFSMPAGTVSDPVDTPRGFWIVKRID